jgi:hypothetical protein
MPIRLWIRSSYKIVQWLPLGYAASCSQGTRSINSTGLCQIMSRVPTALSRSLLDCLGTSHLTEEATSSDTWPPPTHPIGLGRASYLMACGQLPVSGILTAGNPVATSTPTNGGYRLQVAAQ